MDSEVPQYIHCDTHGKQPATYVCQHIAEGLIRKERVGFFWSSESEKSHPDAWCSACNERVKATSWEWVGEAAEKLGVKVMCSDSYDLAKRFHMGENPWS